MHAMAHLLSWISSFLLSLSLTFYFFLIATLTLLSPSVHSPHSFVFAISLRFLDCTLPTIALVGHSNILPSSNFLILSSLLLLRT
ncbi:hypothetical protein BKA57DRAFT_474630 [Linnemannia elongata]|nr:hypothetical protein BKA57DRAFT_474630 [Linnemannia elongata]